MFAKVARDLGAKRVPTEMANATIDEVAAAFDDSVEIEASPLWTRDWIEALDRQPLRAGASPALRVLGHTPEAAHLRQRVPMSAAATELVISVPPGHVESAQALASLADLDDATWSRLTGLTFVTRGGWGGAKAFAASVALEHPELSVRTLDVDPHLDLDGFTDAVRTELSAVSGAARVDAQGLRHVPVLRRIDTTDATDIPPVFAPTDVFLVSGGAKGITAECALGLGQRLGVRLALVGRSAVDHPEVQANLSRMTQAGILARYFRCDITDAQAVGALVSEVRETLGPVAGVVTARDATCRAPPARSRWTRPWPRPRPRTTAPPPRAALEDARPASSSG